jgi:uncharacterized membrane protein
MQRKLFAQQLALCAIVAAVYAVVTMTIVIPNQYAAVQFRIAEILTLLCFYNRKFIPALIVGTFIANLWSPFGWIDWVFGTGATAIAVMIMPHVKSIWIAGIFPVVTNAVIIGIMCTYLYEVPFPLWLNISFVGLGQFTVILCGVLLFKLILEKNKAFMSIIRADSVKIK